MLSLQNTHTISEEKEKKRKAPSKGKKSESYKIFLKLYIYIGELPFIAVWIFLSFPSPFFLRSKEI